MNLTKNILKCGEAILHKPTGEVREFNEELEEIVRHLFEVMSEQGGVGLAANQVGLPLRIAVVDVSPAGYKGRAVLINPVIRNRSKKYTLEEEGCLSIPGLYLPVLRHYSISVEYFDPKGRKNVLNASGYFAKAIQHEIDHLDGILFVERFEETFDVEKIEDEELRRKVKETLAQIKNIKSLVSKP